MRVWLGVIKEMETLTRLFITTFIVFVSLLGASSKTASVNDLVELRPYPFAGNESSAMALCRSKANKTTSAALIFIKPG